MGGCAQRWVLSSAATSGTDLDAGWGWDAQDVICVTDEFGKENTDLWPTIANIVRPSIGLDNAFY